MGRHDIYIALIGLALVAACDRGEPTQGSSTPSAGAEAADATPHETPPSPSTEENDTARAATAPASPEPEHRSCPEFLARERDAVEHLVTRPCSSNTECVLVSGNPCLPCSMGVHAADVVELRASLAELESTSCSLEEYSLHCADEPAATCGDAVAVCDSVCVAVSEVPETALQISVPESNSADRAESPPLPPADGVQERARRLFEAIVEDDPDRAMDLFFPREPFRLLKDSHNPDRYYDRLIARYREDIHHLHETLPDLRDAEFVGLELGRSRWKGVGSEYNVLPYWSSVRSQLVYEVSGQTRTQEVTVMITWGEDWFITHLDGYLD
ncbi:MAG: hypothetical protein KC561_00825 [Myxococcales bacterium]|nr:hypothetical protein [Myxococcales bacterium]